LNQWIRIAGGRHMANGFWRHKAVWALVVASMNCLGTLNPSSSALTLKAGSSAYLTHQPNAQERIRAFEVEVEQLRDLLRIPGLSVAIVRNKDVLWAKGFGYRDYETRLPATPDTLSIQLHR
jgi:CubicO group peptidase (beta-lactamase class C family)